VGHGSVVLLFVVVERELGRIEPSKSITISVVPADDIRRHIPILIGG